MCEVVVTSDSQFFQGLREHEQFRFFREAVKWLFGFSGRDNVIAAIVHFDEKTPHLHFSHVPVTDDGRLCAKEVYSRERLQTLQQGLAKHLKDVGFSIERGVEQVPGAAKKHLNTREFKQQKEAESISKPKPNRPRKGSRR